MYATFNRFEIKMTLAQAKTVSHQGDCYEDAKFLVKELKNQLKKISPEKLAEELKEYGAWDEIELSNHEENLTRIVWIAGCDIVEELAQNNSRRLK